MYTGTQTRIGTLVPKLGSIKATVNLSKAAKLRLQWIDYYQAHGKNARLTCRHFGIAHRTFYRYFDRFAVQGMAGLEARSHRPVKVRQPLTPLLVIDIVRTLRKANPELSKYKLVVLLKKDYGYQVSASTVGRIISRYQLFFTPPVKPKGHPWRSKNIPRIRKPKDERARVPGDLVEVDVKHLPGFGTKRYGFVAIDVVSKQATIHVANTVSSRQGAIAWAKTVKKLGLPKAALTDNGSENLGAFAALLKDQQVKHYFARPHTPKDKPYVERFIGTLERECIQWGGYAIDLADQQLLIDDWLNKYHEPIAYLNPDSTLE